MSDSKSESSPVETSVVTVSISSSTDSVIGVVESPTVTEVAVTQATEVKEKVGNKETVQKAKEAISETGVKIMGTVSEVFKDKHLSGMVKLIVDDPVFIAKVESSVKNILKDGKVDETDIPEFIFLIIEAYNTLPKARLTKEEIPEFVSCVYNYLVEKYNLIPKDERGKYESLVASSVKLLLMTPQLQLPANWKCPCW